jgi:hypothetical protein
MNTCKIHQSTFFRGKFVEVIETRHSPDSILKHRREKKHTWRHNFVPRPQRFSWSFVLLKKLRNSRLYPTQLTKFMSSCKLSSSLCFWFIFRKSRGRIRLLYVSTILFRYSYGHKEISGVMARKLQESTIPLLINMSIRSTLNICVLKWVKTSCCGVSDNNLTYLREVFWRYSLRIREKAIDNCCKFFGTYVLTSCSMNDDVLKLEQHSARIRH